MEQWNKSEIDFHTVSKGSILKGQFIFVGDKKIKEIEPLCSCVGYTFKDNILNVTWKVKPTAKGKIEKFIMIVYTDLSVDDLTLKANV